MKMFLPRTLENIPLQAAVNLDLRRCLIRTIELIGKAFDPKIMKKSHTCIPRKQLIFSLQVIWFEICFCGIPCLMEKEKISSKVVNFKLF